MRKTIKLSEKDLINIVERIINEQSVSSDYKVMSSPNTYDQISRERLNKNINPKNLKMGDGGKSSPEKSKDVKILQQKLMDLNFLKTDTMVPTGYFGELTNDALNKYNKSITNKPNKPKIDLLTPPDKPTSDYLGKGGQFERSIKMDENSIKLMEKIKNIPPQSKSKFPLHVRAFLDYLMGRTKMMTASELTTEERNFLKDVAIKNQKKGFTYPMWKNIGAGNLPTALTTTGSAKEKQKLTNQGSLYNPSLPGQFMYFLGQVPPEHISVMKNNVVTVTDNYDMNSFNKDNSIILQDVWNSIKGFVSGEGTAYSVLRNLASTKEMLGYKGYPVEITV